LLIAVLAVVCVARALTIQDLPQTEEEHQMAFDALRVAHQRKYDVGSDEYARRYAAFKSNVVKIQEIRKVQKSAKFALNLFFDISEEEFRAYRMKPKNIIEERKRQKGTVVKTCLGGGAEKKRSLDEEAREEAAVGALPKAFDWRTHKPAVVSPVKNQAACGSCWTFSTMETLESAWAIAGRGLPILAPQELVDCSTDCSTDPGSNQPVCDQGCDGGWPWAAVQTLVELGGADSEASYPYQGVDGTCMFNKANVKAIAKNHTCISGPNSATNLQAMTELMTQPLSICMDASTWQFYDSGIFNGDGCSTTELDHAIQLVGWGEHPGVFWGTEYFWIVRNSWSASWGESGYIRITRSTKAGSAGNTCGILNAMMTIQV